MTTPPPANRLARMPRAVALTVAACLASPAPAAAPGSKAAAAGRGERVVVSGLPATARASSTLPGPRGRYSVRNLFDGATETAWVEGAEGDGDDEWVEVELDQPARIDGYLISPGYGRSPKTFMENVLPRRVALEIDGAGAGEGPLRYETPDTGCRPDPIGFDEPPYIVLFTSAVSAKRFRITVPMTWRTTSTRYADLAISEWTLLRADEPGAPHAPEASREVLSFAVEVLRSLRAGAFAPKLVSGSVKVRDLLQPHGKRIGILFESVRGMLGYFGASETGDARSNYEAIARAGFIGPPVAVRSDRERWLLHGAVLFRIGRDIQPTEMFPVMAIAKEEDGAYRVVEMTDALGPPPCERVNEADRE